jgi:hypothetical protein
MGRGVRQAETGLLRERFDAALTLTEQVKQLQAVGIGQGAADRGELAVEAILEGTMPHEVLR